MTHPSMDSSQFFFAGEAHFLPENRHFDQKPLENNNHFTIEDLLDFPKDDELMTDAFFDNVAGNSTDSSTVTGNSCNSSVSGGETQVSGNISCRSFADAQLSGELCVPYEDLAELEWLSNFVEDSFSSDDLQNLQLITATTAPIDTSSSETVGPTTEFRSETGPVFPADVAVRGKARSKRSRAIPCTWASRLVVLAPPAISSQEPNTTVSAKTTPSKKRDSGENPGRRCLHCASEKTPQWRTGPMGPKTLCNACGVRYKSGRLVPEYRPAASPTFVSAKHSNSHRKVLELRRQREVQMQQQQQFLSQSSIFGVSNGGDEYLIHHRHHQSGHDYGHMI